MTFYVCVRVQLTVVPHVDVANIPLSHFPLKGIHQDSLGTKMTYGPFLSQFIH